MSKRRLIKKYRIDEVCLYDLGVSVGLYVDSHSGKFYAMVPEQEDGRYISFDKLPELRREAEVAAKEYYTMEWRKVIRVQYETAMRFAPSMFGRGHSGQGNRWDPEDWGTASDRVGPLMLTRCEIATRPDGLLVERSWDTGSDKERKINWTGERIHNRRGVIDLDYTEETWEALHEFRDKIRMLDHAIRGLLQSDDLVPRLLAMSERLQLTEATPLAIPGPTEE